MRHLTLFFTLLLVQIISYGANEYHESKRLSGSELSVGAVLTVTDPNYGQTTVLYQEKKITGSVHLGLDFHKLTGVSDGDKIDLSLGVKVWYYGRTGALIGNNFVTKTLRISYVNKPGEESKGIDALDMAGAYYVKAEITSVNVTRTPLNGTAQPLSPVPGYFVLKAYVQSERYYPMDVTSVPFTMSGASLTNYYDPTSNQLEIRWDYWSGAEDYELEYSYVDDYADKTGLSLPYDFKKNSTRVVTESNHYSIPMLYDKGYLLYRVRPVGRTGTDFKQPLFGKWSPAAPDQGGVSTYPSAHKVMITQLASLKNKNWQHNVDFAEQGKRKDNISYFDGSLRSRQHQVYSNTDQEVVVGETIYDHSGRGVIVTLPVPLSPAKNDKTMFYQPDLNVNINGDAYSKQDFDIDGSGDGCGTNASPMDSTSGTSQYYSMNNPVQQNENAYIPRAKGYGFKHVEYMPDNTGRIRRQSGVGIDHKLGSGHELRYMYESPSQEELDEMFGNDAGFASHYDKKLVIDPNGQVSVSYTDMSGKVIATYLSGDKPSNVDALGSYTGLEDRTTRLLESQYRYSLDGNGNLVRHPYNRNSLSSSNEFSSLNEMGLELQHTIAVTSNDVDYTFSYDVTPEKLDQLKCVDGSILPVCYDCIYDLRITVLNECGEEIYKSPQVTIGTLGSTSAELNSCVTPVQYTHTPFTLSLDKGMYTVVKNLTVNEASMNQYAEEYWLNYKASCSNEFVTKEDLTATLNQNFVCEEEGCANCLETLAADFADHVSKFKENSMSKRQYYVTEKECRDQCNGNDANEILYKTLKADVSLGGQYGCTEYKDGCERTSVFNTSNSLSTNYYYTAGNWRKPYYNELERNTVLNLPDVNAGLNHYFNEYGDVSYIPLTVTLVSEDITSVSYNSYQFAPEVLHSLSGSDKIIQNGVIKLARYTEAVRDPITSELTQDAGVLVLVPGVAVNTPADLLRELGEDQVWVVEPQHLHNVEDFISKWNESWSSSLVVNHPEFCYYKYRATNTQVPVAVSGAGGLSYTSEEFDRALRSTFVQDAVASTGVQIGDYKDASSVLVQLVNAVDAQNENNAGDFLVNKDPFFAKNSSLKAIMLERLKEGKTGKDIRVEIALANRMQAAYHIPESELNTSLGFRFMEDDPLTDDNEAEQDWTMYVSKYLDLKEQLLKEYSDKYCAYSFLIDGTMGYSSTNACIGADNYHPSIASWRYYYYNGGSNWFWNAILSPCGWVHYHLYKNKAKRYNSVYDIDPYGSATDGDVCTSKDQDPEYLHQQANLLHYQQTGQYPVLRDLEGMLNGLVRKNKVSYTTTTTLPDFLFTGKNSGLLGQDLYDVLVYGKPMPTPMVDNGWRNKRMKWKTVLSKQNASTFNYYNVLTGTFRMYTEGQASDRSVNYTCGEVTLTIPASIYSYRVYGAETSAGDGNVSLPSELYTIPLSLESSVIVTGQSAVNGVAVGAGTPKQFEVKLNTLYGLRYIGVGTTPNTYRFIGKVEYEIAHVVGGDRKVIGYKTVNVEGETCIAIDGSLDSDMSKVCKPSKEAQAFLKVLNTMAFTGQFSCGACPQNLGQSNSEPLSEIALSDFYDPILNKYLYCDGSNQVPAHIPITVDCGGGVSVPDDSDFDSGDFELEEEVPGAPAPTSFSAPALPESFSGLAVGENTVQNTTIPSCGQAGSTTQLSVGSTINTTFVNSNPDAAMSFSLQVVDDGTLPPGFTFNINDILGFSCMNPTGEPNGFTATVWVKINGQVVPVQVKGVFTFGPDRAAGCKEFNFLDCGPVKPYTCDSDFNRNRENVERFLDELAGSDVPVASSSAYNYNIFRNNTDGSPVNVNVTANSVFTSYLQKRLGDYNDDPLNSVFVGAQNANPSEQVHYANTLQILSIKNSAGQVSDAGSRLDAMFSYVPSQGTTIPLCGLSLEFVDNALIHRPVGVNFSHLVGFRNLQVAPAVGVMRGETSFTITALYYKNGVYGTALLQGASCLAMENCDEGCVDGGLDELGKAGRFNDPSLSSNTELGYYASDYTITYGEPVYTGQVPGSFITREVQAEDAYFTSTCSPSTVIDRKGLKEHTGGNSHMLVISTVSNGSTPMKAWYKQLQVNKGQQYVFEASVRGVSEYRCAASGQIEHPYKLGVYNSTADNGKGYIAFQLQGVDPTIEESYIEVTYTDDAVAKRLKTRSGRKGEILADIEKLNLATVTVWLRTREYGTVNVGSILNGGSYQSWITSVLPTNQNATSTSGTYQPYEQSGTYVPTTGSSCIGCVSEAAAGETTVSLYYRYVQTGATQNQLASINSKTHLRYDQGWQKLGGVFTADWIDDARNKQIEIGVLITDNGTGDRLIALDDIYLLTECGYSSDNMEVEITSPCEEMKESVVDVSLYIEDRQKKDQVVNDFKAAYRKKCLTAAENFMYSYKSIQHHYTLYYYDQAGNLVMTVPPSGVRLQKNATALAHIKADRLVKDAQGKPKYDLAIQPKHTLETDYRYNSLNQLVTQRMPDHETFELWDVSAKGTLPSGQVYQDASFANASEGYLIANNATTGVSTIFKTTDGAATWNSLSNLGGVGNIMDVQYLTTTIVYAVTDTRKLLTSNDGGVTWIVHQLDLPLPLSSDNPIALHFTTPAEGILIDRRGNVYGTSAADFSVWTLLAESPNQDAYFSQVSNQGSAFYATSYINNYSNGTSQWYKLSYTGSIWQWTALQSKPVQKILDIAHDNSGAAVAVGEDGLVTVFNTAYNGTDLYQPGTVSFLPASADLKEATTTLYYQDLVVLDENKALNHTTSYPFQWNTWTTGAGSAGIASGLAPTEYVEAKGSKKALPSRNQTSVIPVAAGETIISYDGRGDMYVVQTSSSKVLRSETLSSFSLTLPATAEKGLTQLINHSATAGVFDYHAYGAVITSDKNIYNVVNDVVGSTSLLPSGVTIQALDVKYDLTNRPSTAAGSSPVAQTLFAVGSNGNIYQVQYGTASPSATDIGDLPSGVSASLVSAFDRYSNTRYMLAAGNTVYASSDAINWTQVPFDTEPLNGISPATASGKIYSTAGTGLLYTLTTATDQITVQPLNIGTATMYGADNQLDDNLTGVITANNGKIVEMNAGVPTVVNTSFTGEVFNSVKKTTTDTYLLTGYQGLYEYNATSDVLTQLVASTSPINATAINSDASHSVAVGNGGTIYHKAGIGSWNNATQLLALELTAIAAQGQYIAAVGKSGAVIYSADNGATWEYRNSGVTTNFTSIVSAGQGDLYYMTGSDGKVYSLGLSGYGPPFPMRLPGAVMQVSNPAQGSLDHMKKFGSTIAALSSNGTLIWSTDNGYSWNSKLFHAAGLNNIAFADETTMYGVGDNGLIVKTTLSTASPVTELTKTNNSRWTTADLYEVQFSDYDHGYVMGENGTILKTLNRGETWLNKSNPAYTGTYMTSLVNGPNGFYLAGQNGTSPNVKALTDYSDKISTRFWYDDAGRVIASQNTRQVRLATPAYSYAVYDVLGRLVEAGEVLTTATLPMGVPVQPSVLNSWLNTTGNVKRDITRSYYTQPKFTLPVADFTQDASEGTYLNRVVTTTYQRYESYGYIGAQLGKYSHAEHYVYDLHGNVKTLVTEDSLMGAVTGHQYKRLDYNYDLISGKINQVTYQATKKDQFIHRYSYDADNRITQVYTSRDGLRWEEDGSYDYYRHGPVARLEAGHYNLQGLDYAYTLQGWIKGTNSATLAQGSDIGKDASPTGINRMFAKDEIGYTVGYYQTDYSSIANLGTNHFAPSVDAASGFNRQNLYNGNISAITTSIAALNQTGAPHTYLSRYQYDQLNRISSVDKFYKSTIASDNNWTGAVRIDDYSERFTYDANGNILTAIRNGTGALANTQGTGLDSLRYRYHTIANGYLENTNKLLHVNDAAASNTVSNDLEDQLNLDNYAYDGVGNLIQDKQEEIEKIEWLVSGKILSVQRTTGSNKPNLAFGYNAAGQRTWKRAYYPSTQKYSYTFYVHDGSGNTMAVYEKEDLDQALPTQPQGAVLAEQYIYSSTRLAVFAADQELSAAQGDLQELGPGPEDENNSTGGITPPAGVVYDPNNTNHILLSGNVNATLQYGQTGFIAQGSTVTGSILLNYGSQIYIYGTANLTSFANSSGGLMKIYGTLSTGSITTGSDGDYENYGTVTLTGNFSMGNGGGSTFLNAGTMNVGGNILIGSGDIYTNKATLTSAGTLTIDAGAKLFNEATVTIASAISLTNGSELQLLGGSSTTGSSLSITGGSLVNATASAYLQSNGNVTLSGGGTMTGPVQLCVNGGTISGTVAATVNTNACGWQPNTNNPSIGEVAFSQFYGKKTFELANYLGNVMATVSDNKLLVAATFKADATSASDYYAFGAALKTVTLKKYRYGFNGKENDLETSTQDYGMRIYDPRIGKFLSIDPLTKSYPWFTPYQFAGNTPISAVDIDGMEPNKKYNKSEIKEMMAREDAVRIRHKDYVMYFFKNEPTKLLITKGKEYHVMDFKSAKLMMPSAANEMVTEEKILNLYPDNQAGKYDRPGSEVWEKDFKPTYEMMNFQFKNGDIAQNILKDFMSSRHGGGISVTIVGNYGKNIKSSNDAYASRNPDVKFKGTLQDFAKARAETVKNELFGAGSGAETYSRGELERPDVMIKYNGVYLQPVGQDMNGITIIFTFPVPKFR